MKKIEAKIVADSKNEQGDRITTYLLTFPRFILAELNTHRMFSRNSASSRAIPFEKMVKMVEEDPFIPIAWQKYHTGMQGREYLDETVKYDLISFMTILNDTLSNTEDEKERVKLRKRIEEKTKIIKELLVPYTLLEKTLPEWWLFARDKAVEAASILYVFDVTKQLCNRLLEPFMWHTVLVTATEYTNFFELRCPKYIFGINTNKPKIWKSRKDAIKDFPDWETNNDLFWNTMNYSQAEIHIQALAEAMWDAYNESTPKKLEAGEWHIPFGDRIQDRDIMQYVKGSFNSRTEVEEAIQKFKIKIATARCARLSYMTFDGEIDYEKDIQLHDRLLADGHMSPFEHCAKAMDDEDYYTFRNGHLSINNKGVLYDDGTDKNTFGWCNNFRGFIPYRYLIENSKKIVKN